MHDSPSAILRPARSAAATCSSIVVPSVLNTNRSWRSTSPATRALARRLRARPVADVDLELAAAQAGGDLERREIGLVARSRAATWRSRTRGSRTCARSRPRKARRGPAPLAPRGVATAASHIVCSSRGGPGSTITVGPPSTGTTRPGAVPAGSIASRAARDHRLLSVRRPQRLGVEAHPPREAGDDPGDLLLHPSSSSSSTPAKRATTSAVRSSAVGPSPPLVTISSQPSRGDEAQAGLEVLRAVADDEDVGDLDPELRRGARETQGPLRSLIRAVITSVPVTRIPARTLMGSASQVGPSGANARRRRDRVGGGPVSARQRGRLAVDPDLELIAAEARGEAQLEPLALESLATARRQHLAVDQRLSPAAEQADLDRLADRQRQLDGARGRRRALAAVTAAPTAVSRLVRRSGRPSSSPAQSIAERSARSRPAAASATAASRAPHQQPRRRGARAPGRRADRPEPSRPPRPGGGTRRRAPRASSPSSSA